LKYISLVDSLGIDLETLSNLDSQKIIRLQKQLKAKAILNNEKNIGDLVILFEQLKNDEVRKHHVFIEEHPWLKQLLLGSFRVILPEDIFIDKHKIKDVNSLKSFLEPFLLVQLKLLFKEAYDYNKFSLFYTVISKQGIYTEEVLQLITNCIKSKLIYAIGYIDDGHIYKALFPVAFIKKNDFIKSVNVFSDALYDEISELNSTVIDTYNKHREDTTNEYFLFMANTMYAFGNLRVSDVMLQNVFTENAAITEEYTGGYSKIGLGIVACFFIFAFGMLFFTTTGTKSSNLKYDSFDEIAHFHKENASISKINQLDIKSKSSYLNKYGVSQWPYSNPYPTIFKEFNLPEVSSEISNDYTSIKNQTNKNLIIFKLNEENDQAIYIPKNVSVVLPLAEKDTLVFYSGIDFGKTTEPYLSTTFSKKAYVSSFYILDSLAVNKPHQITVYPEIKEKMASNKGKIIRSHDLIKLTNLFYTKEAKESIIR